MNKLNISCPYCGGILDINELLQEIHDKEYQVLKEKVIGIPCQICGTPITQKDLNYPSEMIAVIYHGCRECVKKGRFSV